MPAFFILSANMAGEDFFCSFSLQHAHMALDRHWERQVKTMAITFGAVLDGLHARSGKRTALCVEKKRSEGFEL